MAKYVYPAVFESEEKGGYSVYFPDIDGCFTEGENMTDAIEMAEDALCLMLYDREKQGDTIPEPRNIKDIKVGENDIVSLIACDTQFYKNYFEGKSVKINATIPLWLKEEGEKKHINFSQILQKGVREYLHITE